MRIINELAVGRNKCGECCSKQLILLDTHLAAKIPVVASGCCFVWKRSDSCRILAPEFISELCMQHCTGAEVAYACAMNVLYYVWVYIIMYMYIRTWAFALGARAGYVLRWLIRPDTCSRYSCMCADLHNIMRGPEKWRNYRHRFTPWLALNWSSRWDDVHTTRARWSCTIPCNWRVYASCIYVTQWL